MTNVKFPDISSYEDIETLNMYHERLRQDIKGRGHALDLAKAVIMPARRCSGVQRKCRIYIRKPWIR